MPSIDEKFQNRFFDDYYKKTNDQKVSQSVTGSGKINSGSISWRPRKPIGGSCAGCQKVANFSNRFIYRPPAAG